MGVTVAVALATLIIGLTVVATIDAIYPLGNPLPTWARLWLQVTIAAIFFGFIGGEAPVAQAAAAAAIAEIVGMLYALIPYIRTNLQLPRRH